MTTDNKPAAIDTAAKEISIDAWQLGDRGGAEEWYFSISGGPFASYDEAVAAARKIVPDITADTVTAPRIPAAAIN